MGLWEVLAARSRPVPIEEPATNGKALVDPVEQKGLILSPRSFWLDGNWQGQNPDKDTVSAWAAYATVALAHVCIRYRARKLIEPPIMVVEETDAGEEWLDGHELNPLLARPNPDYPMRRMYELTSVYRDTTGACLWLKVRDRGERVARLYPFPGDSFTVESDETRLYAKFRIETRNMGTQIVDASDVIYFSNLHPDDLMKGLAPIDVALNWLDLEAKLRVAARSALRNSVLPSGMLSIKEVLNDHEFERMQGELRQWHGGPRNVGQPMLGTGGAGWESIASALADVMPSEMWDRIEATVCAVFAVRPEVLGLLVGLKNAPWSHMEIAQRMGYEETALPQWAADEEILTDSLLREVDPDPAHIIRFDTSRIPALQENVKEKADIAVQGSGFLTVDEKRQLLGYEPVGGPQGDTILVPVTMQPLDFFLDAGLGTVPVEDEEPETEGPVVEEEPVAGEPVA